MEQDPPDNQAEYSGPGPDERDPQSVGDLTGNLFDELKHREDPLLQARQHYIDLTNRQSRGESISPADLQAAQTELARLEAERRRLGPPTE